MKKIAAFATLAVTGCLSNPKVAYDVNGFNHTQQDAYVIAHFNDKTSYFLSTKSDEHSGDQLTLSPGTPTHATIVLSRYIAIIEPGAGRTDQPGINLPNPYQDETVDNRHISFITNEYRHELPLPPPPELHGNTHMVAMFHQYTCHVEVDFDPLFLDKSNVPTDQLHNSWSYKARHDKHRFRKPQYNPKCPPFDGGIYEIDLNGGYKKIGDRGVCETDDSGTCVKTREIRDLPPGLVEIPEK